MTPSGIEVLYQAEPKRLYKVRHVGPSVLASHGEHFGWNEVPSVTTVLEVLDKPGLPWWGMKIGVAGALELHRSGILRELPFNGQRVLAVPGPVGEGVAGLVVAGVDQIVDHLTKSKLTVNHVRDTAGDRGQSVHDALETWSKESTKPSPDMFPPNERGYVEGLLAFLHDVQPESEAVEVTVGSVKHGFAGRYDNRLRVPKDCEVVVHRTPVKGPQYKTLKAGSYLADLKTSKDIYPTKHYRQLEGYEGASIECGYAPTDGRFVIHVNAEGEYKVGLSTATYEDFLGVLSVWKADRRIEGKAA